MNLHDIYNALFLGKKLKLSFSSKAEAESLRTALHRYKRDQELALAAAELFEADDLKSLSFRYDKNTDNSISAVLHFKDFTVLKNYEVIEVIEDEADDASV